MSTYFLLEELVTLLEENQRWNACASREHSTPTPAYLYNMCNQDSFQGSSDEEDDVHATWTWTVDEEEQDGNESRGTAGELPLYYVTCCPPRGMRRTYQHPTFRCPWYGMVECGVEVMCLKVDILSGDVP